MKIEKATATLIASVSGVLIGGTAVGVLLLTSNGGTSKPPAPVETLQPAANQIVTSPAPTSTAAATSTAPKPVSVKPHAAVQTGDTVVTDNPTPTTPPAVEPTPAAPVTSEAGSTTAGHGPPPGYHASTHYGPTDGMTTPPPANPS